MGLAAVKDLRELRAPSTADDLAAYEIDLVAEYVLARASGGVTDATIQREVSQLDRIREWFGRPVFEMEPTDADAFFGRELRDASPATRSAYAMALSIYFSFLEQRHQVEIHNLTGRVVECPLDEVNRPRKHVDTRLRIPPTEAEVEQLFKGWREELTTCRKYYTSARNYTVARLISDVGLRISEARKLDLDDVHWDLGHFGKLNIRFGKGSRRRGPKQRMVPLINGADRTLEWFIEDIWANFAGDHTRPGSPLFPSERKNNDGTCRRVGYDVLREALEQATARHLPAWAGKLTPHVLRHYAASQLYRAGMDLLAIQALLGHSWIATTMHYVHVHRTHIEDAWIAGQQRAAERWKALTP
ncbi:tyrosine-type recombinase/integrase [Nonomuraea sp. NPDC049400]|uniref:tyrosine-type recombinase/integrase n=1 Tax=Nonomuraea sp. NPDC049400 TaxID=3364352 RepID=UPI00378A8E82